MLNSWSTLWIQIGVAVLLAIGAVLARLGWYRTHGVCQGIAYVVTLLATLFWMVPVYVKFMAPNVASGSVDRSDVVATVHGALGGIVLLLGAYVILVAATSLVPARFRFTSYRAWMRTLIVLWWIVTALGIWTYYLTA